MKRAILFIVLIACVAVRAEDVRIVTWNVELWQQRFDGRKWAAWTRAEIKAHPEQKDELEGLAHKIKEADEHSLWEVSTVMLDPKLSPDILIFEEGCDEENLKYFNHKWLKDKFETLMVFPSNTGRDQNIGMMLMPGYKVLKVQDDYYKEKDPVPKAFLDANDMKNEAGPNNDKLFARGPAFVLVQTPAGNKLWVGVNHEKSKHGNSLDVAKWRNREADRVHQIIKEVEKEGPTPDVVFGGDMNDELGMQEFEQEAGGDSIEHIVGPPSDGIFMATRNLAEHNAISFGGYFNDRYRSMIDHFFVTASLKDKVADVQIFKDGFAPVASDHYPVVMTLKLPGGSAATQPAH